MPDIFPFAFGIAALTLLPYVAGALVFVGVYIALWRNR